MRAAKGQLPGAVDRPALGTRFYLFHGPDEAGSRALATRLLAALGAEKVALHSATLKNDPAALADEAGAISMFGNKRLLWIEPAGNEITAAVEALLEAPAVESPTVAIAASLQKSSALMKLAESHAAALSHASYVPEGRDADRMVLELGRGLGLRMTPAVVARVAQGAGADQAIVAQELGKFALYLDASSSAPKELDNAVLDLLGADLSDADVGCAGDLALAGEVAKLASELEQFDASGAEPIPAVRALQRRLLQLAQLRARMDGGQPAEAVMASLFWKDKPLIQKLMARWNGERLAQALERLGRLERQLLLTSVGDRAALGQELVQIARTAAR